VLPREFDSYDLAYWNTYGVKLPTLAKYKVYACHAVWVNGTRVYSYSKLDPAYAFVFGTNSYKIYFPSRVRPQVRFISNTQLLQGYSQLPSNGNLLIITKSFKDVMVLDTFGIASIAPQSESANFDPQEIKLLQDRFTKIITIYDFDRTGITWANKIRRAYGFDRVFLTDGRFGSVNYGAKDPSDYRRYYGEEASWKLLNKFLYKYA
jgi:hypothetical protein